MLLHRSTKPSHPAGLTSFGWWLLRSKLNNQIELDLPLTWQKSSKIIKKNTIFFPNPSLHLFVFASEWPLESIHRCPAQCFDSGCTTFFVTLKPSTTRLDDMAVSRFSMFGRNTMVTNSQIDVHFTISDTIFAISFCWRHHPNGEVTQFLGSFWIPSGKLLHNYGKSPCSMGKSTINGQWWFSIAIFDITRGYQIPNPCPILPRNSPSLSEQSPRLC